MNIDPDAKGPLAAPVTTWTYDMQNRVKSETNQTGYADSYVFDADGNMIQETDRDGRVITFTYDRDDRLLAENYSGSSIAFAYSVNGMVTAATDSSSGTMESFAYDNLNRLITENTVFSGVSGTLTQSWGYDRDSNITSYSTKQNGTTVFLNNYTYDAMSRLILLAQADGGGGAVNSKSVVFTYNADSQYDVVTKYHDLNQSSGDKVASTGYSYDSMNRLTREQSNLGSGPSMLIYNQSYNIASQMIALSTIDGTSDFVYDNDGQLQTVSSGAMPSEDYSYDASGNRDSTGYTTGSDNQMTAAPNITNTSNHYDFAYDHEGNTTDRYLENASNVVLEHDVYTWDFRNRMTEVQDYTVSGTVSTLTLTVNIGYDAFDNRVHETVTDNAHSNTVTSDQRFIYDGFNLSVVVDASSLNVQQVFLQGLKQDEVFAQDNVGTSSTMTLWANTDQIGSVRDVLNNSGSVVDHNVLSSFGAIISQSSTGNSMLTVSAGMLWDGTVDLYYDKRRWYDSGIGRFISVDPIGFKSGVTDLYVYCGDNPINRRDWSGLGALPTGSPIDSVPGGTDGPLGYVDGGASEAGEFGLTEGQMAAMPGLENAMTGGVWGTGDVAAFLGPEAAAAMGAAGVVTGAAAGGYWMGDQIYDEYIDSGFQDDAHYEEWVQQKIQQQKQQVKQIQASNKLSEQNYQAALELNQSYQGLDELKKRCGHGIEMSSQGMNTRQKKDLVTYAILTNIWLEINGPQLMHSPSNETVAIEGRVMNMNAAGDMLAKREKRAHPQSYPPYTTKVAGHVPDTIISGDPEPWMWLPMEVKANQTAGNAEQAYGIQHPNDPAGYITVDGQNPASITF